MQPTPDGLNEGQRAALRRLQRAQLAEARRIVHGDVELTHLRRDFVIDVGPRVGELNCIYSNSTG